MKSRNKAPRREALSTSKPTTLPSPSKSTLRPFATSRVSVLGPGVIAICFVRIATLDVRSRKPFHHGPRHFQRQAALCEQTDDIERARKRAVDEREFSRARHLDELVKP